MKKVIAILLVVLALGLMFGCAQKQAAPIKSTPKVEVTAENADEEMITPEEEAETEVMADMPVAEDITEEPEAVPEEEPGPETSAQISTEPKDLPISQEDLDALNAEIESMEFEDLDAFE